MLKIDINRRKFIVGASISVGSLGALAFLFPLIQSLNPAADVLALSTVEVNLTNIAEGETKRVMWRGKPVFIKHRTKEEIDAANEVKVEELPDPQYDKERVKAGKEKWLITVGICTHLGCVPVSNQGDFGGWFCPCHGSHYDTSGRVRKGPAPKNLLVPQYKFLSDEVIKIG